MDLLESDSVDDQEPGDVSSSATAKPLPADHIFHRTAENMQTESMTVESLNLVDHFDITNDQMLNEALKTQSQDKAKGFFEPEFGLLQQHELEQLENISISMKEHLVNENAQKFGNTMNDLNEAHRRELQELRQKYEDQIRLLKDQMTQRELESQTKPDHIQKMHAVQVEGSEIGANSSATADSFDDSTKNIEEITEEFVNEKAALSVKLEVSKKECEQSLKQSHILEEELSQERKHKTELQKTVELQSEQISKLVKELKMYEICNKEKAEETNWENGNRDLEAGEGEVEMWKQRANIFMEENNLMQKSQEQLENEIESLMKRQDEELELVKKEADNWKLRSNEWEQQYHTEMANWRKSFELKSQELKSLRESFELTQEELEISRVEVQHLEEFRNNGVSRGNYIEKDYMNDYQRYLEDMDEKDGEISVIQDELIEKDSEITRLKQLLSAQGFKEADETVNVEDLQLFDEVYRVKDDSATDDDQSLMKDGDGQEFVDDKSDDQISLVSDDDQILSEPDDRNLQCIDGEDLHLSFETDDDGDDNYDNCDNDSDGGSVEKEKPVDQKEQEQVRVSILEMPNKEQEQLEPQILDDGVENVKGIDFTGNTSGTPDDEKLELKHHLQHVETELRVLKENVEKHISEQVMNFQSQLQLQKQVELESLKQQMEESDNQKQSEMRQLFENSLQQLKDQSQQELDAKSEQIKEMNEDIIRKAEEIHHLQSKLDERELLSILSPASQDDPGGLPTPVLQADLDRFTAERNATIQTNNQLMTIMSEMVRVSLDVERRIANSLLSSNFQQKQPNPFPATGSHGRHGPGTLRVTATVSGAPLEKSPDASLRLAPENHDEETCLLDLSTASDEGLDVSQRCVESLFTGPNLDADSEEIITDSSNRLQRAVEQLLNRVEESEKQLHEAHYAQSELLAVVQQHGETVEELAARCKELDELLKQEMHARELLSLELYEAEGLVQGYASEKKSADACIQSLEETKELLAKDLEKTQLKLKESVEREGELSLREQALAHQRHALELSVGDQERGLVQENTQLTEEVRRLRLKLEEENQKFESRFHEAEIVNNELHTCVERISDERNAAEEEYRHKIEALEKQMKYDRQFLEEQTIEREQERDDYQHKIDKLECLMKEKERLESAQNRLANEEMELLQLELKELKMTGQPLLSKASYAKQVKELEDQLREKSESHDVLVRKVEELEREANLRQITVYDLKEFSRSLESELIEKYKQEHVLEERIQVLEQELEKLLDISVRSDEDKEDRNRDLLDLKRTTHDLEEEVERLLRSEQSLRVHNKQLEDEIRNLKMLKEEIMQDKEALHNQVCSQLLQLSSLRSQVESLSFGVDHKTSSEVATLQEMVKEEQETGGQRLKEVSELSEQLNQFKEKITDVRDELEQVKAELDVVQREKETLIDELNSRTQQHLEEKEDMERELKSLRPGISLEETIPLFSQKLLNEKSEEIDQLKKKLVELREYTSRSERGDVPHDFHMRQKDQIGCSMASDSAEHNHQLLPEMQRKLDDDTRDRDLTLDCTEIPLMQSENSDSVLLTNKQMPTIKTSDELNGMMEERDSFKLLLPSLSDVEDIPENATCGNGLDTSELGLLLTISNDPNKISLHDVKHMEEVDSAASLQEQFSQHEQELLKVLNDVLQEKENTIEVLTQQVQGSQNEVDSLKEYLTNLQTDFELMRDMVEEKQKENENLTQELYTMQSQVEARSRLELERLYKETKEKQNMIDEKEEAMNELMQQLEEKEEMERELERLKRLVEQLEGDLKQKTEDVDTLKVQLNSFQLEKSELSGIQEELEESLKMLNIQLSQSESEKEKQTELVKNLTRTLDEEYTKISRTMAVVDDDEEYVGTLCEAVDISVWIDSSFIDNSLDELPTNLELILRKLHSESIKVLSLSDIQYLHGLEQHLVDLSKAEATWLEEKNALLAAINALKQLLSQINKTTDVNQMHGESGIATEDWRGDLLKAVHEVFAKEKKLLHSDLCSYRILHPAGKQNYLETLEKTIKEQATLHRDSLERLISADHHSFVQEVDSLVRKNDCLKIKLQQEQGKAAENAHVFEDQHLHKERELMHQVGSMEFRLKQEKIVNDDLQMRLTSEQSRLAELSTQLSKERIMVSNLRVEIGELQVQLTKVNGQLGREKIQVQSLSSALADEQGKVAHLKEKVLQVQMELQQGQQKLYSEKTAGAELSRRLSSSVERLKAELKSEKDNHEENRISLSNQNATILALEKEIQALRNQICDQESQFKIHLENLEKAASMEKPQHTELLGLLERERLTNTQLHQTLAQQHENQHALVLRFQNTIADLQANLDMERGKVLELTSRIERDRCQSFAVNEEKSQLQERMISDSAVCTQLRQSVKNLTSQKQELQIELQAANQKLSILQIEQNRLQTSPSKSRTVLENVESQGLDDRQRHLKLEQERRSDRQRVVELESMLQVAQQGVTRLEQELNTSRRNEKNALEDARIARLKIDSSPRDTFSGSAKEVITTSTTAETVGQSLTSEALTIYQKHLEMFCQRLHLLTIRLQEELADVNVKPSKAGNGVGGIKLEEQRLKKLFMELTSLSSSMHLESLPSNDINVVLSAVPDLNEKILQHNSELVSNISRLISEKQEFQNIIKRFRSTTEAHKDKKAFSNQDENVNQLTIEQTNLLRDLSLMSVDLNNTRKEVTRLRADLHRAEIELKEERQKSMSSAAVGDVHFSSNKEKKLGLIEQLESEIQRLYGKYLRCDCARKSLIYQKKYLLLLLGGFQDCEEATLTAIARLGIFTPASSRRIVSNAQSKPLSRFRAAATVVVAITRLKFLVNNWRRAARFAAPVIGVTLFPQGSANVPQMVNGFDASPNRSHSMSSVYQLRPSIPDAWVTGSAFDLCGQQSAHGLSTSGTPRSTIQFTPPTKERSRYHQTRHLLGAASENTGIFHSAIPSSITVSLNPGHRANSAATLNDYPQRLEQIQQNVGF